MNYSSSLRPVLSERIEDIIWSKMKLALDTEYQSTWRDMQDESDQPKASNLSLYRNESSHDKMKFKFSPVA